MASRKSMVGAVLVVVIGLVGGFVFAAANVGGVGTGYSDSVRGVLHEVEVSVTAPEVLRGLMPEVVATAEVPAELRGMMEEVEVVADGPVMLLDEVVVTAERMPTVAAATGAAPTVN